MSAPTEVAMCRGLSCRSWACPRCSIGLSRALARKLIERFDGKRAIMVTLTINQQRFTSPLEAYRKVKDTRAIYWALQEFAASANLNLEGKWIAKMELQKNGWPHWHILIEVPEHLGSLYRAFDRFWSLGYSNVRYKGVSVRYLAKYVAKGVAREGLPDLLNATGLPATGIKWVTTSHGFWQSPEPAKSELPPPSALGGPVKIGEAGGLGDRVRICATATDVEVWRGGLLYSRTRLPLSVLDTEIQLSDPGSRLLGRRFGCVVVRTHSGHVETLATLLGVETNSYDERFSALRRPISVLV